LNTLDAVVRPSSSSESGAKLDPATGKQAVRLVPNGNGLSWEINTYETVKE